MKKTMFVLLSVTYVHIVLSQTLPLKQSFEEAISDNWNFTTNPAAFNSDGDIWDRVDDGGQYFSPAPDGSYFWEFYDINGIPGMPADEIAYLTFETVDLTNEGSCTLSFDYCNRGLESEDYISYTVVWDNSNNWDSANEVILPKHEVSLSTWYTVYIPVSSNAQYCRLRLSAKANSAADCGGFDNIQLAAGETIQPELTIESPADGSFYENAVSNVTISGTATNASGMIVWSNALNSASGEFGATGEWCNASVALAEGANEISVTATNANGLSAVERVTLLRGRLLASDGPGSIAFVAFNSAGDSFAFVALKDLPAGTVIRFCDEEWSGVDFGTFETDLVWSNTLETAAGTVIEFYDCNSTATISNNIGVIVSGRQDLSQSGEDIFAYYGSSEREPTTFLAAISTAGGNLNGSGLAYGETAVDISKSPTSQYYCGARYGERAWSDYLPLINSAANWEGTEGITESWGDSTAFEREKAGSVLLLK